MKKSEEGYSMPLGAPTFTTPPFEATQEGKMLMSFYKADKEACKWELPEPLQLEDNIVLAWIGDMRQPSHTIENYHECLTAIKVRYEKWVGWYINYIWVDHDMALTFEREIYGWPANLCENTPLNIVGSQVIGECIRYGEPLMKMSFNVTSVPKYGRSSPDPHEEKFINLIAGDFLQIRKFPPPEKDGKPIKDLVLIPTTNFTINEVWEGNCKTTLYESGLYPHLDKLKPIEVLGSFYLKCGWIVPYPQIIWKEK